MHSERLCVLTGILLLTLLCSCASKKDVRELEDHGAGGHQSEWKEMDNFHMIMAETFHPYKDSANLEPARTRATELLAAADEWLAAALPEKVDNDRVRSKLIELKTQAATLAESVKSSDDNVIADHLTKLHDTFHAIQEAWYD